MIRKIYFGKGNPSFNFEGIKELLEELDKKETYDENIDDAIDSLYKKCEDNKCSCKIEEDLDDFDEYEDEDLLEEDSDFTKKILIDRKEIEEKVYEFLFFDEETEEFLWSYYGDYDYNVAKQKFVEEYDHLDVTFYLA